jgi:RHS repeat-associated protein
VSFERYLWSGETELGALDRSGKITSLRVFGEGLGGEIGAAVLFEVNGSAYIPIHDLCGHLRASLNTQGTVVETLSYTAFSLEGRSGNISPWSFASKRQDELTSLVYFGRRFYDQETAGWLSQDPIGVSSGTNLYAYVSNNPLMMIDLFGLSESEPGGRGLYDRVGMGAGVGEIASKRGAITANSCHNISYVYDEDGTGMTIKRDDEIVHVSSHLAIFSREGRISREQFYQQNKGKNLENTVMGECNGMITTFKEVEERATKILTDREEIKFVIVLYNSTSGRLADSLEAILNSLGFELAVGRVLFSELSKFFSGCISHGISFKMDLLGHSQGAAIIENLLGHKEFSSHGKFKEYIENVVTFGGARIIPNAINYVAENDLVPWLCPRNWLSLLGLGEATVTWIPRDPLTVTSAHSFEGDQYQKALSMYFAQRGSC